MGNAPPRQTDGDNRMASDSPREAQVKAQAETWDEITRSVLKRHKVDLVT